MCKQDKMNGETNSADGSNETRKSTNKSDGGNSPGRAPRKVKLRWKNELQHKFLEAIEHLGLRKAMPKTIQEFMNVEGVTRTHIASHLQKYRRHLKKLKQKARKAEMLRRHNRNYYTSIASCSFFNPQGSYRNTQLNMENLFQSQLGFGLGQSNLILNSNASRNYMQRTRSNLLPVVGSRGYSSGVLPSCNERRSFFETPQVSRVPGLGQYGTSNGSLGLNSGYMRSNYAGISVDANGNLLGVDGNGYGSLGESLAAMNLNFNNNNMSNQGISTSGVPSTFGTSLANGVQTHSNLLAQMDGGVRRSILGTSQASQLVPPFGHYGTRNDVYNTGINTNEYVDLTGVTGLGGSRVNGSLGESVGTMNRDFNNNNMTNHESSSTSSLSSPCKFFANVDRSQSNLNAQLDGLVPILANLSMCNDDFGDTVNSQIDQNQHKGQVSAGNSTLSNDVPEGSAISNSSYDNGQVSAGNHELSNSVLLQMFTINNWSFDNHQDQASAGNPAMFNNVLLEGNAINNWSFNNHQGQVSAGNPNLLNDIVLGENVSNNWSYDNHQGQGSARDFELSNGILLERNAINSWSFNSHQSQVNVGNYELANDVLLEESAFSNGSFDNEQVWDEQTLNSIAASSEMRIPSPTPDIISTINLEQGVAVLADVPLPPIDLDWSEGDLSNFMIDIDDLF